MKIAINIIATNKYLYFLDKLCGSISYNFEEDVEINVIVYTNMEIPLNVIDENKRINFRKRHIDHENWPYTTLRRFEYFMLESDFLLSCDYCYYIDADSLFISEMGNEIFPKSGMIGTIHPCLYSGTGTPERNPESKAFIPIEANNRYYCGGFFGGKSESFIRMSKEIRDNINDDLSRNIIAIWHDESHINRYFYDNPPELTLEPPYAAAQGFIAAIDGSKIKIIFLDKNQMGGHNFFRS